MRFGLFGGAKIGKLDPLGDSYGYRDFIDYIVAADELGFDGIFLVEHHFTGQGQLSASLNLLAYLAARTRRIRLGTAVVVLPWHNPALLAEQVATLDVLSGGRIDFGVGRGYRKAEYDQFCMDMAEGQERYDECLDFILKAWTTEGRFSHHGKRWHYENIVVEPPTVQRPHPPIWIAAGSPESVKRVAASNFNLLVDQLGSIAITGDRIKWYLDELAARGFEASAGRVGVARALNIVHDEAERNKAIERRRDTIRNIGELARRHGEAEKEIVDDGALIGSRQEIIDTLNKLAEVGVEYVLLTNAAANRESLEEFRSEIAPHVRAAPATAARAAHS